MQHELQKGEDTAPPSLLQSYCNPPMRHTVVPQLGHVPLAILVPFFVFDSFGSLIVTFSLHLTQYPFVAMKLSFY